MRLEISHKAVSNRYVNAQAFQIIIFIMFIELTDYNKDYIITYRH